MDKKTLSLNLGAKSGGRVVPRSGIGKKGKNLTEVLVDQQPQRRRAAPPRQNFAPQKPKEVEARPTESTEMQREDKKRAALHAFQEKERLRQVKIAAQQREAASEARRRESEIQEAARREEQDNAAEISAEPIVAQPSEDISAALTETGKSRAVAGKRSEKKQRRDSEQRPSGRAQNERRRRAKIDVDAALSDEVRQRSHSAFLRSQERKRRKAKEDIQVHEKVVREVQLPESIVVQELANRMAERVSDVVKMLMKNGVMVNQNQTIDADTAELIIGEFGHKTSRVSEADVEDVLVTTEDSAEVLKPRSAVVSVMGHVDHGKTSLLDSIRKTNVAGGEAGGITQHIGAYQVDTAAGAALTFLDTPGHAAFTDMRARGAQVTDIVVLVVAADDAVMPQTVEAINHARAADVPIIVAINKIDLPGADPEKVRNELLRHNVIVEQRSGDVLDVEVSAISGEGVDKLLETISLQAELLELKANPDRPAIGVVIESRLDTGRGSVATILVQKGTLKKTVAFVVGDHWGKVRTLQDWNGNLIDAAGPSVPVEVTGLHGTPHAGDILNVVENEGQAKEIFNYRQSKAKSKRLATGTSLPLEELMELHGSGGNANEVSNLGLVIKGDVQGSVEAIVQAVEKIGNEEVNVRVLHSGVGAITETDISLAEASNARVIGFNVRANAPARNAAAQKGTDIRYYSVIYTLLDDVRAAASNLLRAEIKETSIGTAEILETFKITGIGMVAGCRVVEGTVRRYAGVRLLRDDIVIHEGRLKTLKRFKDEVSEVVSGQECGMAFENYANIRKGDFIEVFEQEEIQRSL